jgi:predicted PurR-regulated permease PerM
MALIDTNHQRAALILLLLGVGIAIALAPYATGLIGIPVLYAIFGPVYQWLALRARPKFAAGLVVALAAFLIVVPGVSFATLIVTQAQQMAAGVIQSPLLARLSGLRFWGTELGPRLAGLGSQLASWLGSSAFGLLGTATRLTLDLTIALFGLFYLLLQPHETWAAVEPYIPFSTKNITKLRQRFRDVTVATIIGTVLTGGLQGLIVGLGFWITGLPNAAFWGVVTMVFAILPVVGSGLVWIPGAVALILQHQIGPALLLALFGLVGAGLVDYVVRPKVFQRWADIHPLATLLGALAGVAYFGILGILIGPLALSYFFELMKMYREEYLG